MSKFTKKSNGFYIRYKQYLQNSVNSNTKSNIQDAKNEYRTKSLNQHLIDYDNVNQTIIGNFIFKLIYDAKNNPSNYKNERIGILRELYTYVETNKAWYDLWKTYSKIENHIFQLADVIIHQISTEIFDMFRLHITYPKYIMGLKEKNTPIIEQPPFYLTEKLINYLEYKESVGRKKGKDLFKIQTLTSEYSNYLTYAFGLYHENNLDLFAQNGLNYDDIPSIKFPRQLTDPDTLIKFIEENRHYTINPSGVVIDCYNCEDIEQVILYEKDGYLLWKVIFKQKGLKLDQKGELTVDGSGAEYCGYFSGNNFFPRSLFSEHITYIDFEQEVYAFVLECYADVVCGINIVNKRFKQDTLNMGSLQMQNTDEEEGKMGLSFIPRKTYNKIKSSTKTRKEYEAEINNYFIAGHIRKLPEGHSASKEAISHAQEFGIELPDNHTFVRPYETGEEKLRSHYIKKI